MGAHNVLQQLFLDGTPYVVADPGDAGTLTADRQLSLFKITTAAAETRTLAQPTKPNIMCMVCLDATSGDLTLTVTGGYNQAATTSLTLDTAGDWVLFMSVEVGSSYYWRVISSEGVNVTRTDITATTATATTANVTNLQFAVTAVNATAGGSAIGNAAALSAGFNRVSGADNTAAVKLPVAAAGLVVLVKSAVNGKTLPVFPQVNSSIDAIAANSAITLGATATGAAAMFVATNATHWNCFPADVT